jgi:hypothetical protein
MSGLVMIPVLFGFPAMIFAVPPLMVLLITALAFGVEVTAAVFGLAAVLTVAMDGLVQIGFSLFDVMLATGAIVGTRHWRCHEACEGNRHHCCYSNFS